MTTKISLSFEGFRSTGLSANASDASTIHWLSFHLLNDTFKSNEFSISSDFSPSTIELDVSTQSIAEGTIFPLKVFLCSEQAILAVSNLNPAQGSLNMLSTWVDMMSIINPLSGPVASVKVAIQSQSSPDDEDNERDGIDDYGEESFEEQEEAPPPAPPPISDARQQIEENNIEEERKLRHFRLSVEIRSIKGLKRPSYMSLHFVYPHLGISTPVRSHLLWLQANTETRIDGAAGSYDCTMTREKLRGVLASHSLTVSALSKSHLGNNIMGSISVNLGAVNNADPHSFRCPLTHKVFKTLIDYGAHRQTMLTFMHAGRIDKAPPKDPVIIRAVDSYITVQPATASTAQSLAHTEGKGASNYLTPHVLEGAKMRTIVVIEEIGAVGPEMAYSVRSGYKMHNGGLYQGRGDSAHGGTAYDDEEPFAPTNPMDRTDLTPIQRAEVERLKLDWEAWRRSVETQWREALQEKEISMGKRLEAEAAARLLDKTEEFRKAQEETGRLEIRLKGAIDVVERQKMQLSLKEDQMNIKLAQKTSELQLLQRRVRDEAKALVETEARRASGLQKQVSSLQDSLNAMAKRAADTERDFDKYRSHARATPESVLREETAKLRAQLAESRAEVERERRLKTEVELEKEHFRAQMHRLALALKREREKSNVIARQDLEQMRLEFLAREERYILDSDRDELKNIRNELTLLKTQTAMAGAGGGDTIGGAGQKHSSSSSRGREPSGSNTSNSYHTYRQQQQQQFTPASESKTTTPPREHYSERGGAGYSSSSGSIGDTPERPYPSLQQLHFQDQVDHSFMTSRSIDSSPALNSNVSVISSVKEQIRELLATGMYSDDGSDDVINELKYSLLEAEKKLIAV